MPLEKLVVRRSSKMLLNQSRTQARPLVGGFKVVQDGTPPPPGPTHVVNPRIRRKLILADLNFYG
jgi:hypothetical protein